MKCLLPLTLQLHTIINHRVFCLVLNKMVITQVKEKF